MRLLLLNKLDDEPFNRGKLLNIGVHRAKLLDCNYVALHDVDMIPLDVDYSHVDRPTHLQRVLYQTMVRKELSLTNTLVVLHYFLF